MLSRAVVTLPSADLDYIRIYEHYAYERGVPQIALRIEDEIKSSISQILSENPEIGRSVSEANH